MSQRPKLRPQDELQTRLATARHQQRQTEQMACFILGFRSAKACASQDEADELGQALGVLLGTGLDLHPSLIAVRQKFVDAIESAPRPRVQDLANPDDGNPGPAIGGLGNKVP